MATRNKIINGLELIKLNSLEDVFETTDLYNKCIMCREEMDKDEITKEHVFPKWLQKRYNFENQVMILPNESKIKYNQILVNCCKTCNGGIMSEWENKVKSAVTESYNNFKELDIKIIAWWIYKIYYSKLVQESQLKNDIKDPFSRKILEDEQLNQYNNIYMVMNNLIKGITYEGFIPYEIYIFKTDDKTPFDYIDDIVTHTVYMKLGEILIVCSLDSYNVYSSQYQRELDILKKLDVVQPLQAIELFTKMVYFRSHYGFDTHENYILDNHGCRMKTELYDLKQIKEFDLKELNMLLINIFKNYGLNFENKIHLLVDGKVISIIN